MSYMNTSLDECSATLESATLGPSDRDNREDVLRHLRGILSKTMKERKYRNNGIKEHKSDFDDEYFVDGDETRVTLVEADARNSEIDGIDRMTEGDFAQVINETYKLVESLSRILRRECPNNFAIQIDGDKSEFIIYLEEK